MYQIACDRCHTLKSKCWPRFYMASCRRCFRRGQECSYSRQPGQRGRKKKDSESDMHASREDRQASYFPELVDIHEGGGNSLTQLCSSHYGDDLALLTPSHLRSPKRQPHFQLSSPLAVGSAPFSNVATLAQFFALTPACGSALEKAVWSRLVRGQRIFQDVYFVLQTAFNDFGTGSGTQNEVYFATIAAGLHALRSMPVKDKDNLDGMLWLGLVLQAADRLILGTSSRSIREHILLCLPLWYPAVLDDLEIRCCVVFITFLEITNCLMGSRIPVHKPDLRRFLHIDWYMGLCCELLEILHDVCVLNATAAADNYRRMDTTDLAVWSNLYQRLCDWCPYLPENTLNPLRECEEATIVAQARIYRAAAILTLNRIKYPLEARSETAALWASEILIQTRTCLSIAGEPPPYSAFPLLVAGMELYSSRDRSEILHFLQCCRGGNLYPYAHHFQDLCLIFWDQRDRGVQVTWLRFLREHCCLDVCP